ncbi:thioredoxin domain-containing protein [Lysobacter sp. F6437]|uniref:thioredoxin domain-containing protein n=1 Tax=Lysobacter sp. F6437 TaxID=3459296 RepID=UPI00403E17F6
MSRHAVRLRGIGLAFAAAFALAACAPEAPAPTNTATPATPAAGNAAAPAATSSPASPSAPAAAAAANTPAPERVPGPIVPPVGPAPVAGTDYVAIAGGAPYRSNPGRIEVVEVFGYVCPACAAFQPLANDWKAKRPADVDFTYVPAPFGPDWIPYAKGFYVAESEGLVEQSHDDLIHAIHVQQSMPGEGDRPKEADVAGFYAAYGADPKAFLAKMNSFANNAQVNRGKQFMIRSGVQSTPTLVVNGKYRVQGKSFEDMLRITDHLVAMERAAMAPAPAATPSPGNDGAVD